MSQEEDLRRALVSLEVNADFTEAALAMHDGSRLHFAHRVGERRAWAVAAGAPADATEAGRALAAIARFRLNGKHLDVLFADGSRWEARFRDPARGRGDA